MQRGKMYEFKNIFVVQLDLVYLFEYLRTHCTGLSPTQSIFPVIAGALLRRLIFC